VKGSGATQDAVIVIFGAAVRPGGATLGAGGLELDDALQLVTA
jgi:hypothetical protein